MACRKERGRCLVHRAPLTSPLTSLPPQECVRRVLGRGQGRVDDNVETLKKRFNTYQTETKRACVRECGWGVGRVNPTFPEIV